MTWKLPVVVLSLAFFSSCTTGDNRSAEQIPDSFPSFEILINEPNTFDGYIFLRRIAEPGLQFMINRNGELQWFQESDTTLLRVYRPLDDAYLALKTKRDISEISYKGDTLWTLKHGKNGFQKELHHDVLLTDKEEILAITHETEIMDLRGLNGLEVDTVQTDGLILMTREGEKLWEWSFRNVLDTLKDPGVSLFQFKNDWVHANSVFIDNDGHFLISFRDLNAIWKIDRDTGEVIWKLESKNLPRDQRFYNQHAIHSNLDGDYMMFDNGDARLRKSSRAIAFNYDGIEYEEKLRIELPNSLFTNKQGSVYQFAKDKFLFSSPMSQTLVITDRTGKILWLAKSDQAYYRAYYLSEDIIP